MQIESIVRASAQAVTITTLVPGNVYKRLIKAYDNSYTMTIGVVQSIDNNGVDTLISALEVENGYNPKIEHKVFGGGSDLSIFALTPEEARLFIDGVSDGLQAKVRSAEDALRKARDDSARFAGLVATMGEITAPTGLLIGKGDAEPDDLS